MPSAPQLSPGLFRSEAHRLPGSRSQRARALTLLEVMTSMVILSIMTMGVLKGVLQSRRLTEGSVRQATVASVVQGYLEQIKNLKFATDAASNDLPNSTDSTPATTTAWAANSIDVIDAAQTAQTIYLAVNLTAGTSPTSLPAISSLPTDVSMHSELVDIDNTNSTNEDSTLKMWVWINPLSGTNVKDCKSIVVVYQWSDGIGNQAKTYSGMMRTIRSIVPTD